MNYIDKEYLNNYFPELDISSYSDTTISGIISIATGLVNEFVGYSFDVETLTEKYDGILDSDSNIVIFTQKRPIISVNSVKVVKGDYTSVINLGVTDYDIPSSKNQIVIQTSNLNAESVSMLNVYNLRTVRFFVEVNYTAGYSQVPDLVKQATALYCLDNFSRRINFAGANSVSQGGISISFTNTKGKSSFILDAERLLQNYAKVI